MLYGNNIKREKIKIREAVEDIRQVTIAKSISLMAANLILLFEKKQKPKCIVCYSRRSILILYKSLEHNVSAVCSGK